MLDPECVSRIRRGHWEAGSLGSEGGPCTVGLEGASAPCLRSVSVYTTVPFSRNTLRSSGGRGQSGAMKVFIAPSSGTMTHGNTTHHKES